MPGMIGADLASLESLRGKISTTGTEILERQRDADRIAEDVVGAMTDAFDAAVQQISVTMDNLMTNVEDMVREADQATWEGRNRENFVRAVEDFRTANDGIRNSTTEAYSEFKRGAEQIGELVNDYELELRSALDQATQATASMATAVQSQRDAVDEAMNNSLSYSG